MDLFSYFLGFLGHLKLPFKIGKGIGDNVVVVAVDF